MSQLKAEITELSVGQLAERSGIAVSALHFYEAKGLIRSRRTAGNQRRYTRDTLRRVSFIRVSQRVGIPLNAIREALAELPEERTPTRRDWARLSESWRGELDARIKRLQQLRDDLTDCIGCGCLSLGSCKLSNPSDVLGDTGPGPRRLLTDTGTGTPPRRASPALTPATRTTAGTAPHAPSCEGGSESESEGQDCGDQEPSSARRTGRR